jgi:AraC-like DNA-binding protein
MFARAFSETPHDFLTRLRIDRAKQLLARNHTHRGLIPLARELFE